MSYDTHFKEIQSHRDSIKWVLEQQAALRAEFMTFYKKDLKEIYSALSGSPMDGKNFQDEALTMAKDMFNTYWGRSYNLITPTRKNK